ncbi:MAG TPA: C45 family peptidase [Planctomycetota bacterium]|nr:C45 family peptidase [Planctomycetota bacterium]
MRSRLAPRLLVVFAAVPVLRAQADTVRVLELCSTPYERGVQHGKTLRAEIAQMLERWDRELQREHHLALPVFVERFLAATSYDAATRRWLPEMLDEVRGIAAGAEQPYATMFAWQLIDEVWAQVPSILREKCTAVGVDRSGDQPTIVAQNLDVPRWYHDFQCVLRVRDESRGLQQLIVTIPGIVALAGMSSARVGVAVNTLLQLRPCRDGLPVAFVIRGLLAQPDHAAALAFLQRVAHASGQNYTVGGPETAPGFECSAGKVARYVPYPEARFTWHTNHPCVNDDFEPRHRERASAGGFDPFVGRRPCPRFQVCKQRLAEGSKPDVAIVKSLLACREGPVCNDGTLACIVMLLGEAPELHISKGGSDKAPFTVLRFEP